MLPRSCARLVIICFALAVLANLPFLGSAPLADSTEARHAEIGREFVESGNWLVPRLNYRPHLTKPPVTDWLVAIGISLFGPNEFGARVGNVLMAALGLALAAGLACRIGGARAGYAVAVLGALTPMYIGMSRTISIDVTLAAAVIACLWILWELAPRELPGRRRKILAMMFWLTFGLAVMIKGHLILLFVLLPLLAWAGVFRRWSFLRRVFYPPALLLMPLVILPWFLYIMQAYPGWFAWITGIEFGKRMVAKDISDHMFGVSLGYLAAGTATILPLALLLPVAARIRRDREAQPSGEGAAHSPLWFLAFFFLLPLLVINLANYQRPNYIYPLVPQMAVLAGLSWTLLRKDWKQLPRWVRATVSAVPFAIAAMACACMPVFLIRPDAQAGLVAAAGVIAALLAGLALSLGLRVLGPELRGVPALALLVVACLHMLMAPMHWACKRWISSREACRWVVNNVGADEEILSFKSYVPSTSFYIRAPLAPVRYVKRTIGWSASKGSKRYAGEIKRYRELFAKAGSSRDGVWLILRSGKLDNIRGSYREYQKRRRSNPSLPRLLLSVRRFDPEMMVAHLYPVKR